MSDQDLLQMFSPDFQSELELPYADGGVRAGFPSPAQDVMDSVISLDRELVRHPESTFYARVRGTSMEGAGVRDGDLLVVDKQAEPRDGCMAVCVVDGEFTVKFVEQHPDCVVLRPANPAFPPLRVEQGQNFEVWGVVEYVIHKA